jgi:hypothetical protein
MSTELHLLLRPFVGAVRVWCALQRRCSRAANSATCHPALIEQPNCVRLTADARSNQPTVHPGTLSLCRDSDRADPAMGTLTVLRMMANSFVHLTLRLGKESYSTADGKIKAARCGAVGWGRHADTSGTSHEVRSSTTACQSPQLLGISRLRAPREYCHDTRR